MNARGKIREIISKAILGKTAPKGASDATDVLLAALPEIMRADPSILQGMVTPLVWIASETDWVSLNKDYRINFLGGYIMTFRGEIVLRGKFGSIVAAKAAANAHHAAAALERNEGERVMDAKSCRMCKYFFMESEGWEYQQYDYASCRKRPSMLWLKSFPFKNTKCKTFEAKE